MILMRFTRIFSVLAGMLCSVTTGLARNSISLTGQWGVELGPCSGTEPVLFANLPGTLDENRLGKKNDAVTLKEWNRRYKYYGPATYTREINIPKAWAGKCVSFRIGRTKVVRLFVDGKLAGTGDSLTTSHHYDLTEWATPGLHTLAVEVNNDVKLLPGAVSSWVHQVSDTTQTNWNGMLGEIALEARDRLHIASITARPNIAQKMVRLVLGLSNRTNAAIDARLSIRAKSWNGSAEVHPQEPPPREDFVHAIPPGDSEKEVVFPLGEKAALWDEYDPVLYHVTVELAENDGAFKDAEETDFGLREFKSDPKTRMFTINGRTTFLRGEANNVVFPYTGYAPMEVEGWMPYLRLMRRFGINHIRFHSYSPPTAMLEAADRMGMYVQAELPQWGAAFKTPWEFAYFQRDGERYLLENGNSPSLVMFSLGNEVQDASPGRKNFADMLAHYKKVDPTRLYVAGSQANLIWVDNHVQYFWPNIGDDFIYAGATPDGGVGVSIAPTTVDFTAPLRNCTVPFIAHEVGQFVTFPDFPHEIPKYTGVLAPRNLDAFARMSQEKYLLERCSEFHRASATSSQEFYQMSMERMLATPGLAGFQLLGILDFPGQGTSPAGLVDVFNDIKPGVDPERFRESCSDVTVLAMFGKSTWTSDADFEAEVRVPNFGRTDLKDATVGWGLTSASGRKLDTGEIRSANLPQGVVSKLGLFKGSLVAAGSASRMTLSLALYTGRGVAARNRYDIYVYPPKIDIATPEGVHVERSFSAAAKSCLEQGGRVLLIPRSDPLSLPRQYTYSYQNSGWFGGSSMGSGIDAGHPLFAEFPTKSYVDAAWHALSGENAAVLLDDAPAAFRPILQIIPSFKAPCRAGTLFEANVGKGKLFVCSYDLLNQNALRDHAEFRQLLHAIYAYMGSERFAPSQALEPALLDRLFPSSPIQSFSVLAVEPVRSSLNHGRLTGEIKAVKASSVGFGFNPELAVDGDPGTVWSTQYAEGMFDPLPHFFTVELANPQPIRLLTYTPGGEGKHITRYRVTVSEDGTTFREVAAGSWADDATKKAAVCKPSMARFIRLDILKGSGDTHVIEAGEIGVAWAKETLAVGESVSLALLAEQADGGNALLKADCSSRFSSENPAVARIDVSGRVTAVAPGTARITVTSVLAAESRSATIQITVK